jgi:hypothetical protein
LSESQRAGFRRAILGFLHRCKVARAPASVAFAKIHLAERAKSGGASGREALRWFFRRGNYQPRMLTTAVPAAPPGQSSQPTRASEDLGGADWERALIVALRERGFLWRTEETYRGWAARFARFLAPRSPYVAEAREVGAFLSSLAVESRASQSTQKQALNALVFLMQEALHRELGKIPFQRAEPGRKVPTVLTREETTRLFAQLEGTTNLMAQLAYGAGLRLMELLRLRVHHLDLDRNRLQVYDGKGDRVNGFANAVPDSLNANHVLRLCAAI